MAGEPYFSRIVLNIETTKNYEIMTPSIIATAITWFAIAAIVAGVTLIGASISHISTLVAQRRHAVVPVMNNRHADTPGR